MRILCWWTCAFTEGASVQQVSHQSPSMSIGHIQGHQESQRSQEVKLEDQEDPVTTKTAQNTVTCVYLANIATCWRKVTIIWCKNLMNRSLSIRIDSLDGGFHYTCKINLKPWNFWSKKGYKSFEVEGNQGEVCWDLRSAKFGGGPEPCSNFYVALVCDEEIVLLLGDMKKKAYKRTKSRPALVEALLYHKKENVFAKKSFATRVKFDENIKEHDIVVESSTSGSIDPEMWISMDGFVLIHVKNLQWKFRGNQTVMVNMQPVQVFWDVHDWLFSNPGTGHGLFIFKPGPPESESDHDRDGNGGIDSDHSSPYYSTQTSNSTSSDFCLFLHAYKIE